MGHLINPIAMRLGWSFGWCDSWYVDSVFYPEFLHDIFRIHLYLNYLFYSPLIEKAGLFFSHFEFFFKYSFLAIRLFYYDGVLLTGVYTFNADFFSRYSKRSFIRVKKRSRRLIGSRLGRLFLGLFYSFFKFSDFFKPSFIKGVNFIGRGYSRFRHFYAGLSLVALNKKIRWSKKKRWSKKRRLINLLFLRKKGSFLLKRIIFEKKMRIWRKSRVFFKGRRDFFSYAHIFDLKLLRKPKWLVMRLLRRTPRLLAFHKAKSEGALKDFFANLESISARRRVQVAKAFPFGNGSFNSSFGRGVKLKRCKRRKKRLVSFKSNFYQLHFRKRLRKIFFFFLRFFAIGRFHKSLRFFRKLIYFRFPLHIEFKFFFIFIILFRRMWILAQLEYKRIRLYEFLMDFYFLVSFLFFSRGYHYRFFSQLLCCVIGYIVPRLLVKIGIFLISNDSVTARFISLFIGKKLLQGHKVRATVNPIADDLIKVARFSRFLKFNTFNYLYPSGFDFGFRSSVL